MVGRAQMTRKRVLQIRKLRLIVVAQPCSTLCATQRNVGLQAPLSMGFPRQEYGRELPFPFSKGSSRLGIKPTSPESLLQDNIQII